jgi:cytidine deaminase
VTVDREALVEAARSAAESAYAPYSEYPVGAALAFADGRVISAANVENASYGLSLCAETIAVAKALSDGARGGLVAVAVAALRPGAGALAPCGRCRQVLAELAGLDGADPEVWCCGPSGEPVMHKLSSLLPMAFGPESL